MTTHQDTSTERERFEAWFDRYHEAACKDFGGLDCSNPKGIAEDAWQAAIASRDEAPKDHEIAQAVNALRDIAIEFHGAQQLRERIAHVVVPLLKRVSRDEAAGPTSEDVRELSKWLNEEVSAPINRQALARDWKWFKLGAEHARKEQS